MLVWKAGDTTSNLIESAHSDVNQEGLHCTLVGGISKGQAFDVMKMKTLRVGAGSVPIVQIDILCYSHWKS